MKTIYLHGHLREEFGEKFCLDVQSVAEAIRALEANFAGKFYKSIRDGVYRVTKHLSKDGLREEHLQMHLGSNTIHIVPVIKGAGGGGSKGKGFLSVVLGVTLIAAAVVFAPGAGFAAGGLFSGAGLGATIGLGITYGQVGLFGLTLALSGVSQLLTPQSQVDAAGYANRERPDERPSFLFNGALNRTEQGGPVPYIYGEVEDGSVLIGGSLTPERLPAE